MVGKGEYMDKVADLYRPKHKGGMGFRNVTAFNKALLGKQVWRTIQWPNSLMARIIKGRYFKHGDIIDADLGSNLSFVWRSLFWSRDLIKKSCVESW